MQYLLIICSIMVLTAFNIGEANAASRYSDTGDQVEVSCVGLDTGERTGLFVTAGQSNAANSASKQYVPHGDVYVFHKGKCYEARDPLLGASGIGGTPWFKLADRLIDNGKYDRVIVVGTAISGTTIIEWLFGTPLFTYLWTEINGLRTNNMTIDAVLFMQGEADAALGTDAYTYYLRLATFAGGVRDYIGYTGPLYVSLTTYCLGITSADVRSGQAVTAQQVNTVYIGPDTDTLVTGYRHDNCHFNSKGTDALADMWDTTLSVLE